jgi:hypothetical protein
VTRAVAAAAVATIALVAFGSTAATAAPEKATINTFRKWDGQDEVQAPFGRPVVSTFGQTITVPVGLSHLNKFTFAWHNLSFIGGTMVVRAEVYAWDGTKATGPSLFEKKRTISFPDFLFHRESFRPNGISVTPGAQYVLFASIDKDYAKCQRNYVLGWGSVGRHYGGGQFVSQSNQGDESRWTLAPWNVPPNGLDLAFRAFLS